MTYGPFQQYASWVAFEPGPVEQIEHVWGPASLLIKRLDKIKSWASGNKYYKLKYSIADCLQNGVKTIISKGGMFSNHLEALSRACAHFHLNCVCVIRSYGDDEHNPTIKSLRSYGAELIFLNSAEYRSFDVQQASALYPGSLFIPEGGADRNGIIGAAEISDEIKEVNYSHLVISGGTLSTVAGLLSGVPDGINVIVIPAWKGCTREYLNDVIEAYEIKPLCKWEIWPDEHFGGFGKYNQELARFMYSFSDETRIPLDPVYTGKMMYAVINKLQQGYFNKGDTILAIHTGGLQGIAGFDYLDPVTWHPYAELLKRIEHSS